MQSQAGVTVSGWALLLEEFKAARPAIVVAGVRLPVPDGLWLLGQIRALAGVLRVRVIALTGLVLTPIHSGFAPPGSTVIWRSPSIWTTWPRSSRRLLDEAEVGGAQRAILKTG